MNLTSFEGSRDSSCMKLYTHLCITSSSLKSILSRSLLISLLWHEETQHSGTDFYVAIKQRLFMRKNTPETSTLWLSFFAPLVATFDMLKKKTSHIYATLLSGCWYSCIFSVIWCSGGGRPRPGTLFENPEPPTPHPPGPQHKLVLIIVLNNDIKIEPPPPHWPN